MNEHDSNNELHPVTPPEFKGSIFLVIVQNNKTAAIEKLEAFRREVNALEFVESFDKSRLTATIHLVEIH